MSPRPPAFQVGEISGQLRVDLLMPCDADHPYVRYACSCTVCKKGVVRHVTALRRAAKVARGGGCPHCKKRATKATCARSANPYLYAKWTRMRLGCEKESAQLWPYFGARGIKMHSRWAGSFKTFLADIGPRASHDHILVFDRSYKVVGPHSRQWKHI